MAIRVALAEEDEAELKRYFYDVALEVLQTAKKDLSLDRDLLNKKQCCEWLGISATTLEVMLSEGLPISILGERTFFISKQQARAWIIDQQKNK